MRNTYTVNVAFNGKYIRFDQTPIIIDDRVLVPFRAIFEAFGAEVDWDEETQTVTAAMEDRYIILQIGKPEIQISSDIAPLDVPPVLVNDRTLVPVRAVSEGLGADVQWDEEQNLVLITIER